MDYVNATNREPGVRWPADLAVAKKANENSRYGWTLRTSRSHGRGPAPPDPVGADGSCRGVSFRRRTRQSLHRGRIWLLRDQDVRQAWSCYSMCMRRNRHISRDGENSLWKLDAHDPRIARGP